VVRPDGAYVAAGLKIGIAGIDRKPDENNNDING